MSFRPFSRLLRLLPAFTFLLPAGCDLSDPSPKVEPPPHPVSWSQEWRYAQQGDSLFLDPVDAEVFSYCSSRQQNGVWEDVLLTDTVGPDRVAWAIVGDTLRYDIRVDTTVDISQEGEVTDSGVSRIWSVLVRQGSGAGLEGTWTQVGIGRELVSGTPTRMSRVLDWAEARYFRYQPTTWVFSQGALVRSGYSLAADDFISYWNGEYFPDDSSRGSEREAYDISVRKLDEVRVELRGRKTGEVVTIEWSNSGIVYTSSVTGNERHHFAFNPTSCPNDYEPEWLSTFRAMNRKIDFAAFRGAVEPAATLPASAFGASRRAFRRGP